MRCVPHNGVFGVVHGKQRWGVRSGVSRAFNLVLRFFVDRGSFKAVFCGDDLVVKENQKVDPSEEETNYYDSYER